MSAMTTAGNMTLLMSSNEECVPQSGVIWDVKQGKVGMVGN